VFIAGSLFLARLTAHHGDEQVGETRRALPPRGASR
jgi:hypothetical protein